MGGNARVFVLDRSGQPLMPCHPARARELLQKGRAAVARYVPFTIRLKDRDGGDVQPVALAIDPGSKTTGLALAREEGGVRNVLWLGELHHRGGRIRKALQQRRNYRQRRRCANLRYRAPRFDNRAKPRGWLPPSLRHRVETVTSWVNRLRRLAPVSRLAVELVRFDTQRLENPEIQGVEYQRGSLAGYEVREYLLEKWGRRCAYCDAENVPLQVEHIGPRANGGSSRVSNLTLACRTCNEKKGKRTLREFLAHDPERFQCIEAQRKIPLKDAAAINATRWALFEKLKDTGLPLEAGSGGRTKWNRERFGIPKTHALDALCVGAVDDVRGWPIRVLTIKAMGRGDYQRTRLTEAGFPRSFLTRRKTHFGFRTGDLVRSVVPKGKNAGVHQGRAAVRARGSFNIQTVGRVIPGVSYRHCQLLQRADGYDYSNKDALLLHLKEEVSAQKER